MGPPEKILFMGIIPYFYGQCYFIFPTDGIRSENHGISAVDFCSRIVYTMYIQKRRLLTMTTTIQEWGNGQGVHVLTKTIQELFHDFSGTYDACDIDWGEPVGEEIW